MKSIAIFAIFAGLARAGGVVDGETLQYSINWPSGLSLGEGRIKAARAENQNWTFELQFDASVPGFAVSDRFTSLTTAATCSLRFEKELAHGKRKSQEQIAFDSPSGTATRQTTGGGKSTLAVPACAHDALAFIFHLRNELAAGRIPKTQDVFYGAPYKVLLEYGGAQRVKVNEALEDADRVVANIQGPASKLRVELFFSRDKARTPLRVNLPLTLGTFSMELVR